MALVTIKYNSKYLGFACNISVMIPDKQIREGTAPEEFFSRRSQNKALWLLHGAQGDNTWYNRYTSIERISEERDLVVVTPSAFDSIYMNWPNYGLHGLDYISFFFKELIPMVRSWFPVSDKRDDNYLAGFSMGSFGAMHMMNHHPELFAGVIAMASPPLDYRNARSAADAPIDKNIVSIYSEFEGFLVCEQNIYARVEDNVKAGKEMPEIYWACGGDDFALKRLEPFAGFCKAQGIKITTEVFEGLAHESRFVDAALEKALDFYGIKRIRTV